MSVRVGLALGLLACLPAVVRGQMVYDEPAGDRMTWQLLDEAYEIVDWRRQGGSLDLIRGDLGHAPDLSFSDWVDVYAFLITDPEKFSASLATEPIFGPADTQLFLFDEQGYGIVTNDERESPGSPFSSEIAVDSGFPPPAPGLYYLAVSVFDNDPVSTWEEVLIAQMKSEDGFIYELHLYGRIFPGLPPHLTPKCEIFGKSLAHCEVSDTHGPTGPGGHLPFLDWDGAQIIDPSFTYEITLTGAAPIPFAPAFLRGDANSDGTIDISDAIYTLLWLFVDDSVVPGCSRALDFDDDGRVVVADALGLLFHLLRGAPPPARPFPFCRRDPTLDGLSCEASNCMP